jgi:hypothetical protein
MLGLWCLTLLSTIFQLYRGVKIVLTIRNTSTHPKQNHFSCHYTFIMYLLQYSKQVSVSEWLGFNAKLAFIQLYPSELMMMFTYTKQTHWEGLYSAYSLLQQFTDNHSLIHYMDYKPSSLLHTTGEIFGCVYIHHYITECMIHVRKLNCCRI